MLKYLLSFAAAAVCAVSAMCSAISASAGEPYDVYNYDRWGDAIPSQAGYIADRAVSGTDLGVGSFDSPSDIFCSHDGTMFIADTGNNRIVSADAQLGSAGRVYSEFTMPDGSDTALNKPSGVFVSDDDVMYIADTENSRVLVSDLDGNVIREITKPVSNVFDQNKTFMPQKVLADKAGNVYVVLGNITTGAAMFAPDGEFSGFYGANRNAPTAEVIRDHFFRAFISDKKKARRIRNIPSGISGFDIDGDFIFTCSSSSSQTTDTVKKLNAAGKNIFADRELSFGDYTPIYDPTQNKVFQTAIIDIDIADDGCINCLDHTSGRIFQYDEECELLFITGTIAKQLGGFDRPAALESYGNELFVLDSQKDTVTVFTETDFGSIVHKAAKLHNDGYYEEALDPWYEVLKRDGNYRRAYVGVASALLRKGDYRGAMKYAKLADAGKIYNKAFEGYRLQWLRSHFSAIAALIFAAVFALSALRRYRNNHPHSAARKEDSL